MPELTSPGAVGANALRDALLQQAMQQRQAALDIQEQQKTQAQLALTAQQRATQKEAADAMAQERESKQGQFALGTAAETFTPTQPLSPEDVTGLQKNPATASLVVPAPPPTLQQSVSAALPPEATVDASGAPISMAQPTPTFKGTEKQRTDLAVRTKLQSIADGDFELPEGTDPTVKSAMMVDAHLRLAGMPALAAGVLKQPKLPAETKAANELKLEHDMAIGHAVAGGRATATTPYDQLPLEDRAFAHEKMAASSTIGGADTQLDKLHDTQRQKAVETELNRMEGDRKLVIDKLDQSRKLIDDLGSAGGVGDAIAAPAFLSMMAGGFGTGLRMNNAEINRINAGQTKWAQLAGWLSAWNPVSPNPENQKKYYPEIIQPAMRQQMTDLANMILNRAQAKKALYREYQDKITKAKDADTAHLLRSEFNDREGKIAEMTPEAVQAFLKSRGEQVEPLSPLPAAAPGPAVAVPIMPARPAFDAKKLGG